MGLATPETGIFLEQALLRIEAEVSGLVVLEAIGGLGKRMPVQSVLNHYFHS